MKLQEVAFKKPIKVLQSFKNVHEYTKESKSFDKRKELMEWRPVESVTGYVQDGSLYLNAQILKASSLETSTFVVLTDRYSLSNKNLQPEFHVFLATQSWQFDIFKITPDLEVVLQYNLYTIGIPERENFTLGKLSVGQPLEIKINGKSDFTMSRGKERTFTDQQYILDYLGEFTHAKILTEPTVPVRKEVPENRKLIDLLKPLW